jgi:hypothetical protein
MPITADDFMRTPPRRRRGRPSLLAPYADDLALMKAKGYKLDEMQEFLELNEVKVGVSTISMFFTRKDKDAPQANASGRQVNAR